MKIIDSEEFKRISLDMLISLDEFCKQNNLRYVLDFGTLIGAIRHKGFIPWDDDIDVTMPREDYEKLYSLLSENDFKLGENYRLASARNKYNIYKPYFNLIDIRTITKSNVRKEIYHYPVWIDIFPMDKIKSRFDSQITLSIVRSILRISQTSLFIKDGKLRNLKEAIAVLFSPLKKRGLLIADKIAYKENISGTKIINYMTSPDINQDSDIVNYDEYVDVQFENHIFRAPKNYDSRLRKRFGDYMQLPAESEREIHFTEAYWLDEQDDKLYK